MQMKFHPLREVTKGDDLILRGLMRLLGSGESGHLREDACSAVSGVSRFTGEH